ncbi:hypothetical protein, partial [Vibrio parahaemolyticus]|uniref:hypothetical protein n=1 Tax=Vibrio parahaemolyticus TaxID=670 RepID=UPI002113B322
MSQGTGDIPPPGHEAFAEALAKVSGGDDTGGVAAAKRKVEKYCKTVERRFGLVVDMHRVPAATHD